jgi:hypothetical protein
MNKITVFGYTFEGKKARKRGWYVESFCPQTRLTFPLTVPEIGPWANYAEALNECRRQANVIRAQVARAYRMVVKEAEYRANNHGMSSKSFHG